jgi:hypothetical protein
VAIALLRFITVGSEVIGERAEGKSGLRRVRMVAGCCTIAFLVSPVNFYNSPPSFMFSHSLFSRRIRNLMKAPSFLVLFLGSS